MVEFALTLLVFLALMLGVLDFGRAIFMYNGVSQAAREIARVTSVHPGTPLGASSETTDVVDGQRDLIFELEAPDFSCVDIEGDSVPLSGLVCAFPETGSRSRRRPSTAQSPRSSTSCRWSSPPAALSRSRNHPLR